jgi:hypothetical protein
MGVARSIKRAQQKLKYQKFAKAWRDEKRYQKYLVDIQGAKVELTGEKIDENNGPVKVIVAPNGDKSPMLGRKPTFGMWKVAVDNKEVVEQPKQAEKVTSEKQVEVDGLDW